MLCERCVALLQKQGKPQEERSHHRNGDSLQAAIRAGCFVCCALASEFSDSDRDAIKSTRSSTKWICHSYGPGYNVRVVWRAHGHYERMRNLILVQSQGWLHVTLIVDYTDDNRR